MDGKEYFIKSYFIKCCVKLGIDSNIFIIGRGKKFGKRIRYELPKSTKPEHKYAVKYYENENTYVVWRKTVKHPEYEAIREDLSLTVSETENLKDNEIRAISKGTEYKNGWQETVYVFKSGNTEKFLEKHIKQTDTPRTRKKIR